MTGEIGNFAANYQLILRNMRHIFIILLMGLLSVGLSAQEQKNHYLEVGKQLDIFNNVYRNLDLIYHRKICGYRCLGEISFRKEACGGGRALRRDACC